MGERKIHWVSWNKLSMKKVEGGMGFRSFQAFNEALLAKQGWRILSQSNSLLSQCSKAKYFPHADFLQASEGDSPSFTWRSIWHASWIIKKVGYWRLGNGSEIRIWEDNWLPLQVGFKILSTKLAYCFLSHVQQLISPDVQSWNMPLINSFFYPFEGAQISQIPLQYIPHADKIYMGRK